MKKLLLLIIFYSSSIVIFSQSFDTGEILKPGQLSAGFNPVLVNNGLGLYLHGGFGIHSKLDFDIKYGMFERDDYVGADLEWQVRKTTGMRLSVVTGAHNYKNFALDLGLVASFPVNSKFSFFTGVDGDINFNKNHDHFYWLPVGLEYSLNRMAGLFLEADIPIVDFAPGIFGGGIIFYI